MSDTATVLAGHLYTCDQSTDPCYQVEPRRGETWLEVAERRALHTADILEDGSAT